ncbi:hypothetical protein Q5752_004584 [Cryptotrichosporon argae]
MLISALSSVFSPSALSGAHAPTLLALQTELQALKQSPLLNPHYRMVHAYLDVLNALVEPLARTQGPAMGARAWLIEVQALVVHLHRRALAGVPLNPQERAAVHQFVAYWRQMAAPPYNMARPEAQIVLLTLQECASR